MTALRATVVVCCFNGADELPHVLRSLAAQTIREQVEVLVVDDGSTDGTADVARDHGVRVVVHEHNAGLAAARNTGWRSASAPVVAFTDDDCRPSPEWLERLLPAIESDPDVVGAGGAALGVHADSLTRRYLQANNPLQPLESDLLESDGLAHRLWLYVRRSVAPQPPAGGREVSSVVGANMAFRVETLKLADGFDERFHFGGEEEDLCRRLVLSGAGRLQFVPEALVLHEFEPSLRDTLRRSKAYGRGNARMYLKHPDLSPTVYPLPVLVTGVLAAAALLRRPRWAVAAFALPSLLFAHWPVKAVLRRRPEWLLYPYLQVLQEGCSNLGFAEMMLTGRDQFAAGEGS
jgi:GT2 family glycosyltransferase